MPTTPTIKIEVARSAGYAKRVTATLGGLQACGRNWTEASTRLAEIVRDSVCHQQERALVFCVDGTVLVGYTEVGGFQYAMTGKDRDTSWTCGCGRGYDNMVEAMKRHADSCYGGALAVKRV